MAPELDISGWLCRNHWIFDLDGTLTRPLHDFAAIRNALGVPAQQGILEYIAALPEPQRSRADAQLTAMELEIAHRAEPHDGALKLLEQLAESGKLLGILTRNRRLCVEVTLKRLGVSSLFTANAIIACEDVAPKPDPEGVMRLLRLWQCQPEDALIVGDYRFDLEAGRAAGIATVHMAADRTERWSALTDLEVSGLNQLARLHKLYG